jgi:hypothetical protein
VEPRCTPRARRSSPPGGGARDGRHPAGAGGPTRHGGPRHRSNHQRGCLAIWSEHSRRTGSGTSLRLLRAPGVSIPGALTAVCVLPFGSFDGATAAGINLLDPVIHQRGHRRRGRHRSRDQRRACRRRTRLRSPAGHQPGTAVRSLRRPGPPRAGGAPSARLPGPYRTPAENGRPCSRDQARPPPGTLIRTPDSNQGAKVLAAYLWGQHQTPAGAQPEGVSRSANTSEPNPRSGSADLDSCRGVVDDLRGL